MTVSPHKPARRTTRKVLASSVLAAGILAATTVPANAAVTSTFTGGVLSVNGDSLDNNIAVSRNAAGRILVNGGAVSVVGGTPTVANTATDPGLRPQRPGHDHPQRGQWCAAEGEPVRRLR